MEKVNFSDIEISLPEPIDASSFNWIGQSEYVEDIETAFYTPGEKDLPMVPKITGKPGVGKTTLAGYVAKKMKLPLYIMQCSADTRPEDVLITPVLDKNKNIIYMASPLLAALITGGVVVLDEANRMPEKSWATLASLFDDRRTVYSLITGLTITAHKNFRCAITVNDDSSVYEIPDYIDNRLAPVININFPQKNDELNILKYHLPFVKDQILNICVNFMQELHEYNLPYSTRDAINTLKLMGRKIKGDETRNQLEYLFYKSFSMITGKSIFRVKQEIEDAKIKIFDEYDSITSEFFDDDDDYSSNMTDDDEE